MMNEEIVIDATNSVLGRVASFAAKQALAGKKIAIVNCEKAVILGNKRDILKDYTTKRQRGGVKGPFFPSKSAAIVKRAARGMLPHKKGRGANALDNIKCYEGIPAKYIEANKLNIATKKTTKMLQISSLESKK
jgi:large subunit ribosomal protein L13